MLIDIYMKFIEKIMNRFQFIVQTRYCVAKLQGKLLKSVNARVMVLALCTSSKKKLMLIDICKKLHENSLNSFQVIVLT